MNKEQDMTQEDSKTEAETVLEAEEAASETMNSDDPTSDLLKQIASLQAELASKKDDGLRARAEMENFRKRTIRDKEELRKTATANVIEDLLPVIDNMKLGLQSSDQHPEAKVVSEGFQMVFSQLINTLEQYSLKEVNPEGELFDPNFHDCVAQEADEEVKADHIIKVVRTGYNLNDKLLRPASVITSSGPKTEDETPDSEAIDLEETPEESKD